MVYIIGIIGFIGGFIVGQALLLYLLKDRPMEELVNNRLVKWTYGLLNWVVAGIGAYSFVFLYQQYWG